MHDLHIPTMIVQHVKVLLVYCVYSGIYISLKRFATCVGTLKADLHPGQSSKAWQTMNPSRSSMSAICSLKDV